MKTKSPHFARQPGCFEYKSKLENPAKVCNFRLAANHLLKDLPLNATFRWRNSKVIAVQQSADLITDKSRRKTLTRNESETDFLHSDFISAMKSRLPKCYWHQCNMSNTQED
ncbi:unnamed protein product [Ceratitis capitata]|uniref:(Mediterranean fruit fly) hypothetical protein n=1 Tax=Ceratitis capitata TaxID=7213 RepID=A0A811VHX3_CERCA|nr:unnamed protein product [Ceratitis capitata]